MIDADLNPYLLEVNHSPSFATDSELDLDIKYKVIRDTCKLLDIKEHERQKFFNKHQEDLMRRTLTGK